MTKEIKVSVVIATRNRTTELVRAVRSVLMQGIDGKQIVISDDGSQQDVLDHHTRLIKELGPPHKLLLPSNAGERGRGPAGNRDHGASSADGEFLAFLDDDDYWIDPNYLATAISRLEQGTEFFFGDVIAEYTDGQQRRPAWSTSNQTLRLDIKGNGSIHKLPKSTVSKIMSRHVIHPGQLIIPKKLFNEIGGFYSRLWSNAEDWECSVRLLDRCANVEFYDQPVLCYRVPTGDSISKTEPEYEHNYQRILASHHVRANAVEETTRSAARSLECFAYRNLATHQLSESHLRDSLFYAFLALLVKPTIGSLRFSVIHIFRLACHGARIKRNSR